MRIKPVNVELEEDGVRIALTIVDTPGFGDSIDNDDWWVAFMICFSSSSSSFSGSLTYLINMRTRFGISVLIPLATRSFQEISSYLERQYDDILAEESRIKRNPRFRDNRVHALLYFIPPTGHA